MSRVHWINPNIERGSVRWPACQADISTEEARKYRESHGKPVVCELRAKVNYDGVPLCIRHAQSRALAEMLGGTTSPPQQSSSPQNPE